MCSTASPSAGRTSPRPSTRATASMSSPDSSSRTFGGFESLQLEIRDAATVGEASRGGRDPRGCGAVARSRDEPSPVTAPPADAARPARPPRVADPYGIGPVRGRRRPVLSVVGLVAHRARDAQPAERPGPVRRTASRVERQRQRQWQRRDRSGHRRRRTWSSSTPERRRSRARSSTRRPATSGSRPARTSAS